MQIRKCTEQDTVQLALMNKHLIEDEKSNNPMNVDELVFRMRGFLSEDYQAYFFMEEETIVGYALIKHSSNPLYLRQFYIEREFRRRHYGKQAFRGLMNYLQVDTIDIEVLPWNESGRLFWKSCGFQENCIAMRYETQKNCETEGVCMIKLFTDNMDEYLKEDEVVDYGNEKIAQLADSFYQEAANETEYIKKIYEFVRDEISHSADVGEDVLSCSASEVLEAGHGICFAKSHLLAALLRCKSIPAGFCYQKLILDDETAPVLICHGLNGVYIKEYKKWIRLDARGNKEGVNAQFSLGEEQLAFPVRAEKGEEDGLVIFPNPDVKILEKFKQNQTRTQLWDDLPTELSELV